MWTSTKAVTMQCFLSLQYWRQVYLVTVLAMILAVFFAQIHPHYLSKQWKQLRSLIFCSVVGYGLVPTAHWIFITGGFSSELVQVRQVTLLTHGSHATCSMSVNLWSVISSVLPGFHPTSAGNVLHRCVGANLLRFKGSWTLLPRWDILDLFCLPVQQPYLLKCVCACVYNGWLSDPLTSRGVSLQASSTTWAPATRCGTCCWCWCFTGGISRRVSSWRTDTASLAQRHPSTLSLLCDAVRAFSVFKHEFFDLPLIKAVTE